MVDQVYVWGLVAALLAPLLGGLAALWRPGASVVGAVGAWTGSAVLLHGALAGAQIHLSLGPWMDVGGLVIGLNLRVDLSAAVFLLGAHSLGLAAQLFAVDYLRAKAASTLRLASAVSAATALLLCADNYPLLLVGWALLGAGFHLRAGADYTAGQHVARIWTALCVGDMLLWVAVVALCAGGQIDWRGSEGISQWIGWCLLLAGASRAAQYPAHFWLTQVRDVGALLQVFAVGAGGIYLLLRTGSAWATNSTLVYVAVGCGVLTTVSCTNAALVTRDIRAILAYAMAGQMGLVLAALALGGGGGVALHLAVAGLGFGLCLVGTAYLAQGEGATWDVVALGRWRKLLPLPYRAAVLGALTLAGCPPLAGAWSYGALLAGLFAAGGPVLWALGCLLVCAVSLGPLRVVFMLAVAEAGHRPQAFRVPGAAAQTALVGLGLLALAAGALGYPPGTGYLAAGALRWELLAGPGLAGLVGLLIAWLVYGDQDAAAGQKAGAWGRMAAAGFYGERLLVALIGRPVLALARLVRDIDALVCELAVGAVAATGFRGAGWILGHLQSGQLRFYAALAVLVLVSALAYMAATV